MIDRSKEDPELAAAVAELIRLQAKIEDGTALREYEEQKLGALIKFYIETAPDELLEILSEDEIKEQCIDIIAWGRSKTESHYAGRKTSASEETRKIFTSIKQQCRENGIQFHFKEKKK